MQADKPRLALRTVGIAPGASNGPTARAKNASTGLTGGAPTQRGQVRGLATGGADLRGQRRPARAAPAAARPTGRPPGTGPYSPITAQRKPIMMKNPENIAISPIPP